MNRLDRAHDIRKFEIDLYWKRSAYFWTFIALAFAGYGALQMHNVRTEEPHTETVGIKGLAFLLANVGLVASVAWFQVNRGSKYWQEYWETQIDSLEPPNNLLYRFVIARVDECKRDESCCTRGKDRFTQWTRFKQWATDAPILWSRGQDPMDRKVFRVPSVSKINQLSSLYVVGVWIFLVVRSCPSIHLYAWVKWFTEMGWGVLGNWWILLCSVDWSTTLFVSVTVVTSIIFSCWGKTTPHDYSFRKKIREVTVTGDEGAAQIGQFARSGLLSKRDNR